MTTIMIIDDEKDIRESLSGVLADEGYRVVMAESAEVALDILEDDLPDLILLDIWMPGMDGVELLGRIKGNGGASENLPVIMISGHGTIETAVKTTKLGAYDFIEKPLSLDKVILTVEHALERKRLKDENKALKDCVSVEYSIIGSSEIVEKLRQDIRKVAPTNSWVLITGENGTGKEYVARNLHILSNRLDRPFVEVNCAAIPEELIESELFGHEKGAFTGATAKRKGKFDAADGGTIFLDEIGDMSLKTQAKVLRVLQEQSFERVGGNKTITVDARVIAATNKDLTHEIKEGRFREDLYYRLNVIPFHVPPLRERSLDIPLFVDHFFTKFARKTARTKPVISADALAYLFNYPWPGNVRELKNLIERLLIMVPSNRIGVEDLPAYIKGEEGELAALNDDNFREARADFERRFISEKLLEFNGNVSKTAKAIGVERSHLYRKIKEYKIET